MLLRVLKVKVNTDVHHVLLVIAIYDGHGVKVKADSGVSGSGGSSLTAARGRLVTAWSDAAARCYGAARLAHAARATGRQAGGGEGAVAT